MTKEKTPLTPAEAVEAAKAAHDLLKKVTESRHIAFTSPAPCTSEVVIRNNIRNAVTHLEIALSMMDRRV